METQRNLIISQITKLSFIHLRSKMNNICGKIHTSKLVIEIYRLCYLWKKYLWQLFFSSNNSKSGDTWTMAVQECSEGIISNIQAQYRTLLSTAPPPPPSLPERNETFCGLLYSCRNKIMWSELWFIALSQTRSLISL